MQMYLAVIIALLAWRYSEDHKMTEIGEITLKM